MLTHIGYTNHRLEGTTSLVFDGLGVKKIMALNHALVVRYTKFSQTADRL